MYSSPPASELGAPCPSSSESASGVFCSPVRAWFEALFDAGATPAQERAWPVIRRGFHTLLAAPTGSGKTLAAFLVAIDTLYRQALRGESHQGLHTVYVSPLKALSRDIHENLERPLREIGEQARALGLPVPDIQVALRTGDTPTTERYRLLKRPPQILVTTPESLYLLLTAERSRPLFRNVRTIIIDEVHALARDKRGMHLALTLERLSAVAALAPQRIALSATQRPIEAIARLVMGTEARLLNTAPAEKKPGDCVIVDLGHQRELCLRLEVGDHELGAVASSEFLGDVARRIAQHASQVRTTLVFTNTRRQAERFAYLVGQVLEEGAVAAHHGSLSKERRLLVEAKLRSGELRVLVATASLELGIDVGEVELVFQLGSPRSIATFLQRVGRSGHTRSGTPRGILLPTTRDELIECLALLASVRAGELDGGLPPAGALDILQQQIVAECAAEAKDEDALYELVRRAAPYTGLSRAVFDRILELAADGVITGRGRRGAHLHRDETSRRARGRKGARLVALTSGGAIGEVADYRVVEEPTETLVGTINEDFAIESMAGDVFLLGSTPWRIRRVSSGVVRVVLAPGAAPTLPFWLGEAPARSLELSRAVASLRADAEAVLAEGRGALVRLLTGCTGVEGLPVALAADYLLTSAQQLSGLPTQQTLIVERFFDQTGGMQLVIHSPYGGRINRALGLLARKRFCRSFDFELQAAANDDAVVLSLGPQHSFPLDEFAAFLAPKGIVAALSQAVLVTPMFQVRWRHNLTRSLIVSRFRGGKRTPPPIQRMEADDVMASVFPSLAACQDNAIGPREIPDHPLVQQTLTDCFTEALDVAGLQGLLDDIAAAKVELRFVETAEPSLLAHEILNGRPYTFLDDAPLEERRTRAVSLRPGIPLEVRNFDWVEPAALATVRQQALCQVQDAEALHELLRDRGLLRPRAKWQRLFEDLQRAGRAAVLEVRKSQIWVASERRDVVRVMLQPDIGVGVQGSAVGLDELRAMRLNVLRGALDELGPVGIAELEHVTLLSEGECGEGLRDLEQEGFVLRGRFDPALGVEQFCARRLLARIVSYSQAQRRGEVQPTSPQHFMRFLLDWQGVSRRRAGEAGLLAVVSQLQAYHAPAGEWEAELLTCRVRDYGGELLDLVCLAGDVVWARLLESTTAAAPWVSFTRNTPISLMLREDVPWLRAGLRYGQSLSALADAEVKQVAAALERGGAQFVAELAQSTGLDRGCVIEALWELAARGRASADGFAPLRQRVRGTRALQLSAGSGLRRGLVAQRQGRWGQLPVSPPQELDELAEAWAEQLLARYGVVFRDLLEREDLGLPWRELLWALRRLEARGVVLGGRFVSGFVGEQFALPRAASELKRVAQTPLDGLCYELSACDPLNLVGVVVPGQRIPAIAGRRLRLRDGVALSEEGAPSLAGGA